MLRAQEARLDGVVEVLRRAAPQARQRWRDRVPGLTVALGGPFERAPSVKDVIVAHYAASMTPSDGSCPDCGSNAITLTGSVGNQYGTCEGCGAFLKKIVHEGPWVADQDAVDGCDELRG